MKLKKCPLCNSTRVREVTAEISRKILGRTLTVPDVAYWHCLACREKFFPAPSLRRMEDYLRRKAA